MTVDDSAPMCKVVDFVCAIAIIGAISFLAFIILTTEDLLEFTNTIWNKLTERLFQKSDG